MHRIEDNLALRKELLIARSALCRLRIRQEVHSLRHGLSWREAGAAVAQAPAARDAIFLLAAEGLGRERMAGWLAVAARILALAKLAILALEMLRTPPTGPPQP